MARAPDLGCLPKALFLYPIEAFLVSSVLLTCVVKRAHQSIQDQVRLVEVVWQMTDAPECSHLTICMSNFGHTNSVARDYVQMSHFDHACDHMLVISSELTSDYHRCIDKTPPGSGWGRSGLEEHLRKAGKLKYGGSFQNINHNCFNEINDLMERGG